MSHVRRLRLPEQIAALVAPLAPGRARAAWLRDVWQRRSDGRLRPLTAGDETYDEIRVRLDDELLGAIEAAAERAGLPVEVWMRRAVEAEVTA